ncbi:MAG: glycosyltransferase family 2 protein [Thermoanaerobaculales bacterium]|jgi:glycosyltransferase involved in cell wall biosynthesis|nr:glycosyltransferase family 2 protein [Thermoanaerobaculales bacterium]
MSSKIPVSAVLITRDAEPYLDHVLEPLAVCDEIIVLDSGSTDRTREIAADRGAHWAEFPFDGFGSQKRRAVAMARHDWVLSVDADEILDDEAVEGVSAIDWPSTDLLRSWRIRRRTFIGDREIRHGHWANERPVRLFNRVVTNVSTDIVHETVRPTSSVDVLPGCLLHFSYRDLSEVIRLDYHRLKAVRYRGDGRRAGGGRLALRAAWAGFHSYFLRRGFLEGGAGVVIALAAAVNASMGLAMASEPEPAKARAVHRRLRPVASGRLPKTA